jgi:thymidylate synthase (FAD)
MKIIPAGYEILTDIDGLDVLKHIERVGRVCYKSEGKITDDSCILFVRTLINKGHEAMLEHYSFSVKFTCDRGISHEIVRHRLFSFAQESTRYCNYGNRGGEITVIRPFFFDGAYRSKQLVWEQACIEAEADYLLLLEKGASPQEARSVLPNSLKTEIIVTGNLREWRHFLKLRTASVAHPQMREITQPLLRELKLLIPEVFDDIPIERGL